MNPVPESVVPGTRAVLERRRGESGRQPLGVCSKKEYECLITERGTAGALSTYCSHASWLHFLISMCSLFHTNVDMRKKIYSVQVISIKPCEPLMVVRRLLFLLCSLGECD